MTTKLLPALDVLNGRAVRLTGGSFDKVTDYGENLQDILTGYAAAGCEMAHLVDLSGARNPADRQLGLLTQIVKSKPLKIQVGGGIRTEDDVRALFDTGVDRVVIGSWAVKEPKAVQKLLTEFGNNRFVLALDCTVDADGEPRIAVQGWTESSGRTMHDVMLDYKKFDGLHVLCTDITRDGKLTGPNVPLYRTMVNWWPHIHWIASGGVSTLDDLAALAKSNIPAVVVGKALYEGRFTVQQALATLAEYN